MSTPAVVYLLWVPAGIEPVRQFAQSLREFSAGAELDLVVAVSGGTRPDDVDPLTNELVAFAPKELLFEGPRLDLATYRESVDKLESHESFVFMNSYSRVLADDWLAILTSAVNDPTVGLASTTGSYESFVANRRFGLGLIELPQFPLFPNAHARTSTFALRRETILKLDWPLVAKKREAWQLESGRRSITKQVQKLGLRTVVVDRFGKLNDPEDWPASETFRSGEQRGLLVADRRTDDYKNGSDEERELLRKLAWG